jgi:uncharacterized iron-regulated protein
MVNTDVDSSWFARFQSAPPSLGRWFRSWRIASVQFVILSLTTFTLGCWPNPVLAAPVIRTTSELSSDLTRSIAQARVIYLGETHDSAIDHELQLQVIHQLHRQNPRIILAMEMFQRPYQSVLDRYRVGELSEAELVDRTEYKTRWGFPWELYAPIVRFSQVHKLPIIALNTPTEVTRKVGRKGLDSLTWADRRFIPPMSDIVVGPTAYRDRVSQFYLEMHQGKGNSEGLTRFFQAQVLWDETMADGIARAVKQYPHHQILVLVGQGHLLYGDGIPDRVMRRLANQAGFSQVTVILNPDPSLAPRESVTNHPIADWIWRTIPKTTPQSGTPEKP